jgi:hypothetical protein
MARSPEPGELERWEAASERGEVSGHWSETIRVHAVNAECIRQAREWLDCGTPAWIVPYA